MSEVLTLCHWEPNANSGKPTLTLKGKGADFVSRYGDMTKFEHHSPEYLAMDPLGVVPAATHGELKLYESTAIMEYVDAAFDGQAQAGQSGGALADALVDEVPGRALRSVRKHGCLGAGPGAAADDTGRGRGDEAEDRRHPWRAGRTYSPADINAFNTCYFLPMRGDSGVSDEKTPHLMEWLRKIYERPAVKQAWDMGRTFSAERLAHLKRPEAA